MNDGNTNTITRPIGEETVNFVLEKLHDDHKHFDRLLSFLEEQHQILELGEETDLAPALEAIRYMKEYPDSIHHPLEDVVFHYFLEHYSSAGGIISDLLEEHTSLPPLTHRLLSMFEGALAEMPQDRIELCMKLETYIDVQRQHINREEKHIYPLLSTTLTREDWAQIKNELVNIDDPLFGKDIRDDYSILRQRIVI